MSVIINITGDAETRLKTLANDLHSSGTRHAVGGSIRRLLMDHLGGLDKTRPNKIGGKRSHFYKAAARNTSYEITSDGALVHIHQEGIALHYYGGIVKPTGGRKFLTIPVDPSAYGKRAGEFDNLEIAWGKTKSGKPRPIGLVRLSDDTPKKGKKGKNTVPPAPPTRKWMFNLVLSAAIPEDKSIIPADDTIQAAALSAVSSYIISKMGKRS